LNRSSRNIAPVEVLYEDNHLIAINKKPSDIVQGDKTGDEPLSEAVKRYIKEKYNKPGKVFLGVVHRLDRPASGVVVFARTSKALSRMNELIRDNKIGKTYWAVVKNKPPEAEAHLVHYLIKNQARNTSFAYPDPGKNRKKAELKYRIVAESDNYYLLEVDLITGRHHQIRVQLSAIGCPIKGDLKYGFDRSNRDASIHLHARKMNFIHPVSNKDVVINADPPDEPLWDHFAREHGSY
jgi:23S rRNA pseudouridine1911/1915/1917 synthase